MQTWFPPQPPHETVREVPQRSVRVTDPQVAPAAEHSSASVSGLHTQELPEHIWVVVLHVFEQELDPPQALETVPQATPLHEGVGHSHEPELHTSSLLQEPQELTVRWTPQLSVVDNPPHALLLALQS